jgi:antagonist of KipI
MSITILKPGFMCSIQDLGRRGFQQYGIPISGAMDMQAAKTANRICGNEDEDALLECTLHGTEILIQDTTVFSITGGGSTAILNGQTIPFNKQIKAIAGSVIKLLPSPIGFYTYLAFAGGLKTSLDLGSSSTYNLAALGGKNGKPLEQNDRIELKNSKHNIQHANIIINEHGFGISNWKSTVPQLPHVNDLVEIKCHKGPEWDLFEERSTSAWFNSIFIISQHANRMGFQLEGAQLEKREKKEMISTAVTKGIVQVTNQGTPIILMADAQTIGGYPRIGRIFNDDINLLAQCRPGTKIKFVSI